MYACAELLTLLTTVAAFLNARARAGEEVCLPDKHMLCTHATQTQLHMHIYLMSRLVR